MTVPNMQLPPPCVTGVAIPSTLMVQNSALDNYQEAVNRRRMAQQQINEMNKPYSLKNKNKKDVSNVVKCLLGVAGAVGIFFGGKYLIKHFKK